MGTDLELPPGVVLTELKIIPNERGDVFHALKASDITFSGFGEAYFSTVNHGAIKGWKKHTRMAMNLIVPVGEIEFYIHDDKTRRTFRFLLGPDNYKRLTISPGFWVAFRGSGSGTNLLLNLSDIEHDPTESINKPLESIAL